MADDNVVQHPTSDRSIIDLLKQDYTEIANIKDVYIPIKGWERSGLALKYRLPHDGRELDALARKVQLEVTDKKDTYGRNFKIAMDTMIRLNEGLFVRHPSEPDVYVELDPEETGSALDLGNGDKLSPIFGWNGEVNSARDVVRMLFNNNDLAIIAHAEKLNRWLMDTKADLSTEIWQGELA